jgi:hypothetical protein
MQWIQKNKTKIIIVCGLTAIMAAVELFLFRLRDGEQTIKPWQLGFIILPWLVFSFSFMPLVYLSWFQRSHLVPFTIILKVFFWILIVAISSIWVFIYGNFVFQLW